MYIYINKQT